ncbi:2-C-methyl-D-erythritol 4-phosphate cytidylyltransferase [Histophilus somni]|uniref:2-C-methyl-D-erythritol 4-phosphate cytidylyltransferase n=1 Tax=Histophilus somni TaxID=731 RepID=UPI000039714D|nr:2-C-methyl-D-erythritol 4-phosphate cytidylyltransferase [Histophilus somni]ACA32153.1 2-C-methyl-D-erythritol 4-phosphate cytidylyltransferase [Histophilus somni 2336]QQF86328.1 2-C-methyl-D-erythritol 4-phosphate cytidylyltransferase [Histophilus somni]QQJ89871.1 2-C-methyl-D-erythritol 4-phosphate cytidylyltransferase [Histophilus somni]
MDREIVAIIPAAGIGCRMQADRPKQYLKILGKTILEHTLSIFLSCEKISQIVLSVAENDPYLIDIELLRNPRINMVIGGKNRAESVLNGLRHLKNKKAWVLVHDAARPCLRNEDLDTLLQVEDQNGAILAIPAVDTIKRSNSVLQIQCTEDRNQLWLAQTPQFFPVHLLQHALEQAAKRGIIVTDEALAMELAGFRPHLVAGHSDNIKVTRPEDLALAEFFLTRKQR